MRQLKKSPRKQLEKFSTVFMQLGLVLSLFVVYVVIEHQTEVKTPVAVIYETDKPYEIDFDKTIIFKKIEIKQPVVEQPEPQVSNNLTQVNVQDDPDFVETIINKPEDTKPTIVDVNSLPDEPVEIIDEKDDPTNFLLVEEIPIYRGCEGLNKEESKKCFVRKITKHVQRHFNSGLGEDLGLRPGKQRMYATFVIGKTGEIIEVKVKAPHPRLKKEAQRIVNKIPLFTPGKQQGKPVKVKYTLPITFYIE